ncbi:cytochrome b-c1 complex subunit 2, mitochondrial [Bicyclus anynana]|uniref:Cytochrome b-c1 complex subunit 2, mitochondrial n=1 Tax=Bicyclus anynana TaxID=110368 RepID=A0A6J1N005_BICAN|nr:cytochrome b-c1 complex subunit 2, mitochondrial [Bicyclus anynana]
MKKLSCQIFRSIFTSRHRCLSQYVYGPREIQKSEMLNGIQIVAARCSGSLMTACTIMFQAGSRYETNDDLGATHFIRAMSSGSGGTSTAFAKLRLLQQQGAYLTCTSDRQSLAFTLRCPLPLFCKLKDYLVDAAIRCPYSDWVIDDRRTLVRGDLTRMSPEQRVLDLVQNACWAGPLGNSMFCEEGRINSMSSDTLMNFAKLHLKTIHCAVASVGIPFEETVQLAEMIEFKVERPVSEQCHTRPCFRRGIETYDMGPGSETWIAAALTGCGTNNVHELFKHTIVASACGVGNMFQSQHELDRTAQGPARELSAGDMFAEYRAFNISYAETGIFGIVAKSRACSASNVAYLATDFLANVFKLNAHQIEDGKKRLQLSLALHDEDPVKASQGLALQALTCASIDTVENSISLIDSVSNHDIAGTAATLASKSNQMAIAIVGDVNAVPTDIFYNM